MAMPWEQYKTTEAEPTKSEPTGPWNAYKTEEPSMLQKAGELITTAAEKVTPDLRKILTKPETLTTKISEKIGAPVIKDVSIDRSKMRLSPAEEYAGAMGQRALEATGAGIAMSPFTGGTSIPAAAFAGALQGLAEKTAQDLGMSADLQQLSGLLGPAAGGFFLSKVPQTPQQVNSALNSEAATAIKSKLAEKAISKAIGTPSGLLSVGRSIYERFRPVDYKAVGREVGAKPETLGVGGTKFTDETVSKLSQQYPDIPVDLSKGLTVSKGLYEKAKGAYDSVAIQGGKKFTDSEQFKQLHGDIPAEKTKFEALFQNPKGEAYTGQDVVENLKFNPESKIAPPDLEKARKAFNDFLSENKVGRVEEQARGAYDAEAAARAKDTLPSLFENKNAGQIRKEMWNLSKSEEGTKIFNQELLTFLKKNSASDARRMWGQIGPDVKYRMKIDDDKYTRITNIINGAKTNKDVDRATRILRGALAPYMVKYSENVPTEE